MGGIRVALVEDHTLIRMGIKFSLDEQHDIQLVGAAATAAEGLKLLQTTQPDIAIIDIFLPDMDGIELVQRYRATLSPEEMAHTKIMMLTGFTDEKTVLSAFAAGADSYCVKTTKCELFVEAIHMTYAGQPWIDPAIARIVLKQAQQVGSTEAISEPTPVGIATGTTSLSSDRRPEEPAPIQLDWMTDLTEREQEVLALIIQGHSNLEIADKMQRSLSTVKSHVRSVMHKLAVQDRTQAAIAALRAGWVHSD